MKLIDAKLTKIIGNVRDLPNSLKEIALIGKSNSGKSSFINYMFANANAYTSNKQGKTRTINFYETTSKMFFVDTPGIGYAGGREESLTDLLYDYLEYSTKLILVIMIVDIRHPLDKKTNELIDYINSIGKDIILIANKADKAKQEEINIFLKSIQSDQRISSVIYGSALKGRYDKNIITEVRQLCQSL